MNDPSAIRNEILQLTREYSRLVHSSFRPANDFGKKSWEVGDSIPYAGRVFTEEEVEAAVASTLDFWLTLGREGNAFQNAKRTQDKITNDNNKEITESLRMLL